MQNTKKQTTALKVKKNVSIKNVGRGVGRAKKQLYGFSYKKQSLATQHLTQKKLPKRQAIREQLY